MPRTPISALANGTILTLTTAPQATRPLLAPEAQVPVSVVAHGTTTPLTVYEDESSSDVLSQPVLTSASGSVPGFLDAVTLANTGADLQVALPGGTETVVLITPGMVAGGALTKAAVLATGITAADIGADAAGAAAAAQTAAEAASDAHGAAAAAQSAAEAASDAAGTAASVVSAQKGAPGGLAVLDDSGRILPAELPTTTVTVISTPGPPTEGTWSDEQAVVDSNGVIWVFSGGTWTEGAVSTITAARTQLDTTGMANVIPADTNVQSAMADHDSAISALISARQADELLRVVYLQQLPDGTWPERPTCAKAIWGVLAPFGGQWMPNTVFATANELVYLSGNVYTLKPSAAPLTTGATLNTANWNQIPAAVGDYFDVLS